MSEKLAAGRKIDLGEHFHPLTGKSSGGDANCDHDYDEKPTKEYDDWAYWTCTRCGLRRSYEVYD